MAANAFSIIGIVGKPGDIRLPGILARLVSHLTDRGCHVLVDRSNAEAAPANVDVLARGELGSRADLVVVIGVEQGATCPCWASISAGSASWSTCRRNA